MRNAAISNVLNEIPEESLLCNDKGKKGYVSL